MIINVSFPYRGGSYVRSWVEYDITNNQFIDRGETYLSSTTYSTVGYGVFYTQLDATTLYTTNRDGTYINVFDLQSLSYQQLSPAIPTSVDKSGCLASSKTPSPRLYLTGGNAGAALQVLDLDSGSWLDSLPSMSYSRQSHGCVTIDTSTVTTDLWVMGQVTQIEYISTSDIQSASWTEINDQLPVALEEFSVVASGTTIYVIGGGWAVDTVYTIDTMTNTVAQIGSLPEAVHNMGVIVVDGVIYGFGGHSSTQSQDKWMTLDLLSVAV